MTDREKICREFCEACGGHWHEWDGIVVPFNEDMRCTCGHKTFRLSSHILKENPQYLHPDEVLQMLMKREDFNKFNLSICDIEVHNGGLYIRLDYIVIPDKLLITAHKWVMERKRDDRT